MEDHPSARQCWSQIAVIGDSGLSKRYVSALATQSVSATQVNASAITLAGLTVAYKRMKG